MPAVQIFPAANGITKRWAGGSGIKKVTSRFATPRWDAAIAGIAGGGNASLVLTGDSTTTGVGSTTPFTTGLAGALVAWGNDPAGLNVPTRYGANTPTTFSSAYWTFAGGWYSTFSTGLGFGITAKCNAPSTAPMRYTAPEVCDGFRLYYRRWAGAGNITATATGGTPVVQATSGTEGYGYFDCLCDSAGSGKYVDITCDASAEVVAVSATLTGWNGLTIHCGGAPGMRLQQLRNNIPVFVNFLNPDCVCCAWGINDASTGYSTPTFMGYVQTLLNGFSGTIDKIWQTPFYMGTGAGATRMLDYIPAIRAECVSRAMRYGDAMTDRNNAYSPIFGPSESVHLYTAGYAEWAKWYQAQLK